MIKRETLLRSTLWLMLALSCVSFIEPSPYEIMFFVLAPVALLSGLSVTRTTLLLALFVSTSICAEGLSLMPYVDAPAQEDGLRPIVFTAYSVYLWISALLFALIFSQQTQARVSLALRAYAISCVVAGIWAFLSYLNVAGIGDHELIIGRYAGPFKDPNVLGSYCVLGTLIFLQAVVVGKRHRVWNAAGLLVALMGVFFSFSRGSWGSTVVSMSVLIFTTYVTAKDLAIRRRVRRGLLAIALFGAVAGGVVASNDTIRSTITERAKVEQDYDGGVTGRFGNQKRAVSMLIERPLGFGPHRFTWYFDLDPHSSYIGAFSAGGWIGGCNFLLIVIVTTMLAIRLMSVPSPFRREAQVVAPALLVLFLQGFQIDIDHWRFLCLMLGMIWGMESARVQESKKTSRPKTVQPVPTGSLGLRAQAL